MLKTLFTTALVLFIVTGFSQTDKNGNPVFNSVITGQEAIGPMQLTASYYTLKNNIDNKHTAVFIAKKPTLDDIANAATTLPSDFFILSQNSVVLNLLLVKPNGMILVIDPATKKSTEYPFKLSGIITQNRANEIIANRYDATALIKDSTLFFNNRSFSIITSKAIKDSVLRLIEEQHLGSTLPVQALSKQAIRKYIVDETKEGGKLDFFTAIKGKEYNAVMVKPGLFSTLLGMSLYNWGKACVDLGVENVDEALSIFEEFRQRKLNQRETDYIKMGFEKKLDK